MVRNEMRFCLLCVAVRTYTYHKRYGHSVEKESGGIFFVFAVEFLEKRYVGVSTTRALVPVCMFVDSYSMRQRE